MVRLDDLDGRLRQNREGDQDLRQNRQEVPAVESGEVECEGLLLQGVPLLSGE